MAKPRLYLCNRPNPEEPGDGDDKEGGAETGQGRGGEGGGGKVKERTTHNTPPPPTRRSRIQHRAGQPASAARAEALEEQDPKEAETGEEEDGDTPRGGAVEVRCVGGGVPPPQRKTQTSWDSPLNMRT